MQASSSWMWSSWAPQSSGGPAPAADEVVPRSTAAAIGGALRTLYVPSTRTRFSTATPQYAGLASPQSLAEREQARQAAAADRVARNSLAAFTPRMALADLRAAAVGGGDGGEAPLRGLAVWCLLAALLVASMRW